MTLVMATTMHAYVTDQDDSCLAWLYNAEAIIESLPADELFVIFAALETDARGLDPFNRVLARMQELARHVGWPEERCRFDWWTFSFDDRADRLSSYGAEQGRGSRLRRITMGQNLCNEYAMAVGASHLLFCAADCAPPGDVFPKLLEMDHPLVAPEIPTYGLWKDKTCTGTPIVEKMSEALGIVVEEPLFPFPVLAHMASAACVMLSREVFRQLRWRVDPDAGMTDDPCLHRDALEYLGIPTYVRQDCVAHHYPESIGPIESRGHDMTVHR